jgi:hypothetical protein
MNKRISPVVVLASPRHVLPIGKADQGSGDEFVWQGDALAADGVTSGGTHVLVWFDAGELGALSISAMNRETWSGVREEEHRCRRLPPPSSDPIFAVASTVASTSSESCTNVRSSAAPLSARKPRYGDPYCRAGTSPPS